MKDMKHKNPKIEVIVSKMLPDGTAIVMGKCSCERGCERCHYLGVQAVKIVNILIEEEEKSKE
jgi:hypothetical protein